MRSCATEGGVFGGEEVKQGREPRQGGGWKSWRMGARGGEGEREGARGDL